MTLLTPLEKEKKSRKNAFEHKVLKKNVLSIKDLPTPSASVMKLMLLLRDDKVDMDEIISLLERDQSMVSHILKLINSGFYGLRSTINSVGMAVHLLGLMNVKQVVYSASLMDMFSSEDQCDWDHSYSSSILIIKIVDKLKISVANNLPLTMLMHDIGKVVLRRYSPAKYAVAMQDAVNSNTSPFMSERKYISADHAEVASWLMEKWDMPDNIIYPIKNHHETDMNALKEFKTETALIQYTNWIDCKARKIQCERPNPVLLNEIKINTLDDDEIIKEQRVIISQLENKEHVVEKGNDNSTSNGTQVIGRINSAPKDQAESSASSNNQKDEFDIDDEAKADFEAVDNSYTPEHTNVFVKENIHAKIENIIEESTDMGTAVIKRK